jgi:hypothetical protein
MFRYWQNENFEVTAMLGEDEHVDVFGTSPTAQTP